MTQIITFGNFKGGVGKTTNSVMVANELSNRNNWTLLIDLDPQGNATNILLKTKFNLDGEIDTFKKSLMTCIQEEDLTKSIISIKNVLCLMASAPDFSLYPRYMENLPNYEDRVKYFSELLSSVSTNYDYIIIDVPPTISLITDSALYASDYSIVVMQTHEHSLVGSRAFLDYIQEEIVDTYKAPRLFVLGILAVLMRAGAPVDEATIQNAISEFGSQNIFNTTIHSMQRLKRYGITGLTYDSMYDKKVFRVYKKVVDEMLKRIEVVEHVQ